MTITYRQADTNGYSSRSIFMNVDVPTGWSTARWNALIDELETRILNDRSGSNTFLRLKLKYTNHTVKMLENRLS